MKAHRSAIERNRLRSLPNVVMTSIAVLTIAMGSVLAQANSLTNPGFESGLSGWRQIPGFDATYAVNSTNDWVYGSGDTIHASVHSGANALKIWGNFWASTSLPGVRQTLTASPGSQWAANGWVSTQVPDNIQANGSGVSVKSYLEVQFLGVTTNLLSSHISYPPIDTTSPTDTWLFHQVEDTGSTNLTAPAGTAFVRLQLVVEQPDGYPGGSVYWDDVSLVKTAGPDPDISGQPVPATVVYGQTATFSVIADGQTALSYVWQKDDAPITDPNASGINSPTLTVSNVTITAQGNYSVTVSDAAGSLTSDPAYLTVLDPGIISITPALGQTLTNGGTAVFTVEAAGSFPITYAWQLDGLPLSNGGNVSGATTDTLTVANLTEADAGTYTAIIDFGWDQASSGLNVVPATQVTNLLDNPGFEYGAFDPYPWENGWATFNGVDLQTTNDVYFGSSTHVSVYAGNYVSRTYAGGTDNGLYEENVPVTAGMTYQAGAHFYMSSLDPVVGPAPFLFIEVQFKDADGDVISTFQAPQITPSFTKDVWTHVTIPNGTGGTSLVAPPGSTSLTCFLYMYAAGSTGSVFFDNLYVTPIAGVPPAAVTLTVAESGGMVDVSFPSTDGVTYEVLYADVLGNPTNWQTNSTVIGDGTVKTVSEPASGSARFYSVLAHD